MGSVVTKELTAVRRAAAPANGSARKSVRVVNRAEVRLAIENMRDDACARCIEGALELIAGVEAVGVSVSDRTARVVFDTGRVREWQFERAVRAMGYELKSCERVPARAAGGTRTVERSTPWNG